MCLTSGIGRASIPSMSLESEPEHASTAEPEHAGAPEPEHAGAPEPGHAGAPGRSGQRGRLLDDPVAIRAVAHPLRHELMSIIGRLGRATTADAAREIGISHGLASHHLRQLAKYGFVEQVKGKDHRERPWRLVATSYNWSEAKATAEGAAAVDVLEQVFAEEALETFLDRQQRRKKWPQAWREYTGIGTSTVYLTQAETRELVEAI